MTINNVTNPNAGVQVENTCSSRPRERNDNKEHCKQRESKGIVRWLRYIRTVNSHDTSRESAEDSGNIDPFACVGLSVTCQVKERSHNMRARNSNDIKMCGSSVSLISSNLLTKWDFVPRFFRILKLKLPTFYYASDPHKWFSGRTNE